MYYCPDFTHEEMGVEKAHASWGTSHSPKREGQYAKAGDPLQSLGSSPPSLSKRKQNKIPVPMDFEFWWRRRKQMNK